MIIYKMTERSKEFPEDCCFIIFPSQLRLAVMVSLFCTNENNENIRHKAMETSAGGNPKT